jgi:hypothetical protein
MLALSIDRDVLEPGMRVEVRDRFKGSWARGFEIESADGDKFRVRRLSDGTVLPVAFAGGDLRLERRKQGLWWY